MKTPVKFRPLLNLTAFAVGVGLAAAWHLNRKEADPPQAKTVSASERGSAKGKPEEVQASAAEDDSDEMASSTDGESAAEDAAAALRLTLESPMYLPGSPGFAAEQRRNRRLEVLELTLRLGLSAEQSAELEAALLRDLESRSYFETWLLGEDAKTKWLKENLTPAPAKAYNQHLLAMLREVPEAAALDEVHKMANVLDLTPEQRFAIFATETRKQMIRSSGTLVATIASERTSDASTANPAPPVVENPLPAVRDVREILTPEQWQLYQDFLRGEEELLAIKARELKEGIIHE